MAAPSTPKTAREEALSLAEAGEQITYTKAKAIKQKHSPLPEKPVLEISQPQLMPVLVQTPKSTANAEIVKILSQCKASVAQSSRVIYEETLNGTDATQIVKNLYTSQPSQPEQLSTCWQLGTRSLLYCQNPESPELLQRLPEKVSLLLALC